MNTKKIYNPEQYDAKEIAWLMKNKKFIRFTEVERHLDIPAGLISAQLQGHQDLSPKHLAKLKEFIQQINKL